MTNLAINEGALRASSADFGDGKIHVQLEDGRELYVPLAYYPELLECKASDLTDIEVVERGRGLFFRKLDEAISIASLFGATDEDDGRLSSS